MMNMMMMMRMMMIDALTSPPIVLPPQVKGNELVVSNTIRNDSGFYQCEVIADDRVYAVGTARLLVNNSREAPDAPTNVECTEKHPTALTVAWKQPSNFKDIHAFSVHYMPLSKFLEQISS